MNFRVIPIWFGLLLTLGARAQDPATPAEPTTETIAVEVQCVTLPRKLATPIIRKLRSPKVENHTQAMGELDALLDQDKAKLLGWPNLTAHSGEKATWDHVEELRYATQWEPGMSEVSLQENDGNVARVEREVAGLEASPVASAFDTRNVGLSLNVTPEIQQGGQGVTVHFDLQHVRLKAIDRVILEQTDTAAKRTRKTIHEQPRFLTMKIVSNVTMPSGDHCLIGNFPSPEGEDEIELFIMSTERLERKK